MMVRMGDLVAVAFDEATRYSSNPREVSRLATRIVRYLLRSAQDSLLRARKPTTARSRRLAARSTCCYD